MKRHPEILNELNEISPAVANLSPQNPFVVPAGYFEGLATRVMSRIKAMDASAVKEELEILSPVISNIDKKNPYTVQPSYFETLADEILSKIKKQEKELSVTEELEQISPLLSRIEKKMPHDIPEGYFKSLHPVLPVSGNGHGKAKVVALPRKRSLMNYAAAAIITGFIALSAWLLFFNNGTKTGVSQSTLVNIDEELPKVSDEEMAKYLENIPLIATEEMPVADNEEADMESILKDMPENELQQYLQENPEIKNGSVTN
ncbi:MAG: hypothetical protein SFU87_14465 [Chitinophagaceae bacterium]|nr:hypothetical protein [Chitinophagaceae bacterium]